MTNDESVTGKTPPLSLRAVHKLGVPDALYDLRLQRELEIANAQTRIELGASGGCVAEDPERKPCLSEMPLTDEMDVRPEEAGMLKLKNLALAGAAGLATSCALVDSQGLKHAAVSGIAPLKKVDQRYVAPKIQNGELIMQFSTHNFSAFCFETIKCQVLYSNRYVVNDVEPSGQFTDSIRKGLTATWLGIKSFPGPVRAVWTSMDGVDHDESIDLDTIFRSRRVLYAADLDLTDIDLGGYYFSPDIILVIEDRSLHVFMKSWVWLLDKPGIEGRRSRHREDLIVAYTHTY